MTSRERWTIYPLLFLALGHRCAARSLRLSTSADFNAPIDLLGDDGKPRMQLSVSRQDGGQLRVCDAKGNVVAVLAADSKFGCGQLALATSGGKTQVLIGADGDGGLLQTVSARGALQVLIHSESDAGEVIAFDRSRGAFAELSVGAGPSGVALEQAQGPNKKPPEPSKP